MEHKTNYGQRFTTRINSKCFVIFATLFALCLASPAFAKPKKPKIITRGHLIALALCRASVDEKKYKRDVNKNDRDGQWCCSKEAGFCIECPRGEDFCVKTPYFSTTIRKGIMSQPPGQVTAPTKAKPRIPAIMGTFNTAPVTNSPTKDKPKPTFPTKVWKFQKAPVTNAPTADKPKTGPAIIKNRIQ